MELGDYPEAKAKRAMALLFEEFPSLQLRYGELDTFRSASAREPNLGSSYDGKPGDGKSHFDVLCLYYDDALVASLSFFLEKNEMRKVWQDHFARIDIVVAEKAFRKMGAGRLLVFAALKYLLDRWGTRIYSISSLAAHDAMVRILEEVGFEGEQDASGLFKREAVSFDDLDQDVFAARINARLAETIQSVHFRLRQGPAAG